MGMMRCDECDGFVDSKDGSGLWWKDKFVCDNCVENDRHLETMALRIEKELTEMYSGYVPSEARGVLAGMIAP